MNACCQNAAMQISKKPGLPPGTVRSRIERICEECGYSSFAELADVIGQSRSNMNLWMQRNTYGPGGANQLHDTTGADLNWLNGRGNDAFPNGAKINPALKVQNVYAAITENRRVGIALVRALFETTPALARAWMKYLEPASQDSFSRVLLEVAAKIEDPASRIVPIGPKRPPRKP